MPKEDREETDIYCVPTTCPGLCGRGVPKHTMVNLADYDI